VVYAGVGFVIERGVGGLGGLCWRGGDGEFRGGLRWFMWLRYDGLKWKGGLWNCSKWIQGTLFSQDEDTWLVMSVC